MGTMNKRELRFLLRSKHQGPVARDRESAAICAHVLKSEMYQSAMVIGAYMPLHREADIGLVLADVLKQRKTLVLPRCEKPPVMTMRKVASLQELCSGSYGVWEPPRTSEVIPPEQIDLLLVPMEGIDKDGWRLG